MPSVCETYESWLIERGIESTPPTPAAGVPFFDVHDHAHALLVATCGDFEPKQAELKAMLQKLALAIGGCVSVILTGSEVPSMRGLFGCHKDLKKVIVLGPFWTEEVFRCGIQKNADQVDWIFGPEALDILIDPDTKRNFWNDLRRRI